MTKDHSAIQCAARRMTCLWVTEQLYHKNITPVAIFTNQELALPPRTFSVYSIRKPDMYRQKKG